MSGILGKQDSVIERQTFAQQVLDQLVIQLMASDLKSGDRVATELSLMEQFGVSRSSVREAVKALQNLGILDSRPALGTFISENENTYSRLLLLASLLSDDEEEDLFALCTSLGYLSLWRLHNDFHGDDPASEERAKRYVAKLCGHAAELDSATKTDGKDIELLQLACQLLKLLADYPSENTLTAKISSNLCDSFLSKIPPAYKIPDKEQFSLKYLQLVESFSTPLKEFNNMAEQFFSLLKDAICLSSFET